MTIDEAIEEQELLATSYMTVNPNHDAAQRHREVAEFLREARLARLKVRLLTSLRDGFKKDAARLRAENAELRRACHDLRQMLGPDRCYACDEPCMRLLDEPPVCELDDRLVRLGVEL